jgi:hypothetical protein
MHAVFRNTVPWIIDLTLNPMGSGDWSPGFHLAGENPGQTESTTPTQVTGNWQKRENTDARDLEEDVHLSEFMEEIKRYIRNIDVSDL